MFKINQRTKMGLFRLEDVYYATETQQEHKGYDAVYYFNCQKKPFEESVDFKTMLIDLSKDPQEILRSFRKKTRVEIEKALANNQVHFAVSEHPTNQELEAFCSAYDLFAVKKNIKPANRKLLKNLQIVGNLIIASAFSEDEMLCQFAVIDTKDKIVCYHGYNTRFWNLKDVDKLKLISKVNRALEYHCMIYAKKRGKKYYDLCGITQDSNDEMAENVDLYKRGFRGEIITEYHFILPITFKGSLYCWLKQLVGGIDRKNLEQSKDQKGLFLRFK